MDSFIIRKIDINDLEGVAEITTKAWKLNYKGIIDDDFLQTRTVENFIEKRTKTNWINDVNVDTYIYEEDKIIKGYISGNKYKEKYDCEIGMLYIDPDYQKQGIGTKLLEFMKARYKNIGYKSMII